MRLTEDFSCISFATNLMPLRGEAFFFGIHFLPTFCRYAAKHSHGILLVFRRDAASLDFSLASSC